MAFGELISNKTISISIILANKAFTYLLILEDITKPTPVTNPFIYILNISNPFIYILNISSSRYISDMFLSIIIDIRTSRKSITGYNQFQAL
jgi:hypothetical protein